MYVRGTGPALGAGCYHINAARHAGAARFETCDGRRACMTTSVDEYSRTNRWGDAEQVVKDEMESGCDAKTGGPNRDQSQQLQSPTLHRTSAPRQASLESRVFRFSSSHRWGLVKHTFLVNAMKHLARPAPTPSHFGDNRFCTRQ